MGTEAFAAIAGIASAVAVVVTSLRKRKDVDYEELQKRVVDLEARIKELEPVVVELRRELLATEAREFKLRRVLLAHGIPDPTEASS